MNTPWARCTDPPLACGRLRRNGRQAAPSAQQQQPALRLAAGQLRF